MWGIQTLSLPLSLRLIQESTGLRRRQATKPFSPTPPPDPDSRLTWRQDQIYTASMGSLSPILPPLNSGTVSPRDVKCSTPWLRGIISYLSSGLYGGLPEGQRR